MDITLLSTSPPIVPKTYDQPRTPGCHVSGVIKSLCIEFGHLKARDDQDMELVESGVEREIPSGLRDLWELGCMFEEAVIARLEAIHPGRYIKPGEFKMDGIYMSPDILDTHDWAVEEVKSTWMSSRRGPEDEKLWKWWVQIMAYCRYFRTRVGRLRVVYIRGDYNNPRPEYRYWERRFSHHEIEENWAMIVSWAKRQGMLV